MLQIRSLGTETWSHRISQHYLILFLKKEKEKSLSAQCSPWSLRSAFSCQLTHALQEGGAGGAVISVWQMMKLSLRGSEVQDAENAEGGTRTQAPAS